MIDTTIEKITDPHALIVGEKYRIGFSDCCVNGEFTGRFVELENPGYYDGSGDPAVDFDYVVFDTGKIDGWGLDFVHLVDEGGAA